MHFTNALSNDISILFLNQPNKSCCRVTVASLIPKLKQTVLLRNALLVLFSKSTLLSISLVKRRFVVKNFLFSFMLVCILNVPEKEHGSADKGQPEP